MNFCTVPHITRWHKIKWMLVQFHKLPNDTTSHECWYSSTHYRMTVSYECWYSFTHKRMTQHHMNVGTVPHISKWDNITWILLQVHTLPNDTASHECWYSSSQYQMTQHHMEFGTVPHRTRWPSITWMLVQIHTLPDDTKSHELWYSSTHYRMTASHECWYSSTHYRMTHHINVGTVPHITGWHIITWMLLQFYSLPN
jgi:hypothetical protein